MLLRNGDDEENLYTPQETRVGVDVESRKAYFGKHFAFYGFIFSMALGLHGRESEIIAFTPVL
jgi:hypothetical protein